MRKDRWFRIGLIGTIVAAICCFTPVAVGILAAIGLASYSQWLDPILIPTLIVFAGIMVTAMYRNMQR